MLTVKNISYSIKDKILLSGVSVVFEPGKLNLIIGPNGAGKSTLIKIISGQLLPTQGVVEYNKKNITILTDLDKAKTRAVLSQNIEVSFPLRAREVVMMGRYPHFSMLPQIKDEVACEEAMRFFDVWDMAERNYGTLSGGEKQRVHFARVLTQLWYPVNNEFRYLILDEPLTFLDVYYQFQFMNKIQELLKQKDIVVIGVLHDLNLVAKFADQITLLHNGKLIASGNKNEVLTPENIKLVYQLHPIIHRDNENMYLFF